MAPPTRVHLAHPRRSLVAFYNIDKHLIKQHTETIRHIIEVRAQAEMRWLIQNRLLKRKDCLQRCGQGKGNQIRGNRWWQINNTWKSLLLLMQGEGRGLEEGGACCSKEGLLHGSYVPLLKKGSLYQPEPGQEGSQENKYPHFSTSLPFNLLLVPHWLNSMISQRTKDQASKLCPCGVVSCSDVHER